MFRLNSLFAVVLLPFLFISGYNTNVLQTNSVKDSSTDSYLELIREAEAKTQAKEWKDAATLWERATQMNPTIGRNWIQLANSLYEAKQYRKAITAYEKWNELGASYP